MTHLLERRCASVAGSLPPASTASSPSSTAARCANIGCGTSLGSSRSTSIVLPTASPPRAACGFRDTATVPTYTSSTSCPNRPTATSARFFGEGADSPTLLWSIGSLALAEKSINTSLGRRPFSYKRTIYPKSQYLLTRVLGEKPDIGQTAIDRAVAAMKPFESWSRADIMQRAEWLSRLAAETWSIPAAAEILAEPVVPA